MNKVGLVAILRDRHTSYIPLKTREAAAKAIEAAEDWIPVAEQTPPNERVLLTDGENIFLGCGGIAAMLPSVTHWRPRPSLPEAVKKGEADD